MRQNSSGSKSETRLAMAKVVVIGNSGVGKSSILARCQGESFAEETRPTIGIDFVTKKVPFTDDRYII